MSRRLAYWLCAGLACAAGAGPDAWAKMLWMLGATGQALPLISDEAARGAAAYELGRFGEADETFARVGRSATYNRGLSLAATGEYDLSMAYFDAVLFSDQYDSDARHNRDVVSALVEPVVGKSDGHGRIHALLNEAGLRTHDFDPARPDAPIVEHANDRLRERVYRPLTGERTMAAGSDWLDTLADAPGEYLASRLAAEHTRRIEAGEAATEEEIRW